MAYVEDPSGLVVPASPRLMRAMVDEMLRRKLAGFTRVAFETVNPGQTYRGNWHIEAIAHALTRVLKGETKRLIITVPPRSLKSLIASVAFPAYVLGRDPTKSLVCVSYADTLASQLANAFRAVMRAPWYRRVFPDTRIDPGKDTEAEVRTTRRGVRFSTSVGGTLTGMGGDIIVIDDPIKAQDAASKSARDKVIQWYSTTLLSRLNNQNEGAIVLVMQRLHVDDLAGHLLDQGGWEHLNLPAIAEADEKIPISRFGVHKRRAGELLHPERLSKARLDALKAELGSAGFSAQYQQEPVPPGGNLIRREWLRSYERVPRQESSDYLVISWDTAMKATELSDYSVGTVWLIKGGSFYLLEVVRERLDYPDLRRRVVANYRDWQPDVLLIEEQGSGISLIQDLEKENIHARAIKPSGDKLMRMSAQSVKFESGAVFFPQRAPWRDDLLSELLAFPNGRHDDQVDSISQVLNWDDERKRNRWWSQEFLI